MYKIRLWERAVTGGANVPVHFIKDTHRIKVVELLHLIPFIVGW